MTIKTEHAGAKNGGGYWGRRAVAKNVSNHLRRQQDKAEAVVPTVPQYQYRPRPEGGFLVESIVYGDRWRGFLSEHRNFVAEVETEERALDLIKQLG